MAGESQRGRAVTGQHGLASGHPLRQRLGRIGEQFAGGTVAQRLSVEFIGERLQIGPHGGIDRGQGGQTRGEVAAQTELVGHRHPRREHGRAARGGFAQWALVGRRHHHPGTAARGGGRSVHQHGVTRIITGDHQNVQRSDPGRRIGGQDEGFSRRTGECGGEHGARGLGCAATADPDHGAGPLPVLNGIESTLLDGGRGRPDRGAGQRRGAEQSVAIGLQQSVGVVEVNHGVSRTHVLTPVGAAICSAA